MSVKKSKQFIIKLTTNYGRRRDILKEFIEQKAAERANNCTVVLNKEDVKSHLMLVEKTKSCVGGYDWFKELMANSSPSRNDN